MFKHIEDVMPPTLQVGEIGECLLGGTWIRGAKVKAIKMGQPGYDWRESLREPLEVEKEWCWVYTMVAGEFTVDTTMVRKV